MSKNKKQIKQKKKKVKVSERFANAVFCETIDILLKMYHNGEHSETMSFEEYCAHLRDLSIQKVNKNSVKEGENTDV